MLINSVTGILSQCINISNHHIVHFKYRTIPLVNYTSITWENVIYVNI